MTEIAKSGRPAPMIRDAGGAELRRLTLFLCMGLAGLIADAALFAALERAGLSLAASRAVSLSCATIVTFLLNRRFTFASSGRRMRRDLARYVGVTMVAQGFSYGMFLSVLVAAPKLSPLVALVTGAVAATSLSFAGQRLFTFRGY